MKPSTRRYVLPSLTLAALLLIGVGTTGERGLVEAVRSRSGQLEVPPAHGWTDIKPVGTTFTNGIIIVRNVGESPIILLEARPQVRGYGLRYLGAQVSGMGRQYGASDTLPGYPPRMGGLADVKPLEGAVLEPGERHRLEGVELLLGYQVVSPGRSSVTGVDISYRVDGRVENKTIVSTMAICTQAQPGCVGEYPPS